MKDLHTTQVFLRKQVNSLQKNYKSKKVSLEKLQELIFNDTLLDLDDFIECITKLCWICIYDNNPDIEDYETWYRSLERLSLSDSWILEVMALCANCFR